MTKRTFLNIFSQILGKYFDIEEIDNEGKVIIEGEYKDVESEEPEEPSYISLKEQWTQSIIDGDMRVLDTFLKQYQHNHQKTEKLVYLFKDNTRLAQWLVSQNNNELYLRLPIEIWEMVDELVKPNT